MAVYLANSVVYLEKESFWKVIVIIAACAEMCVYVRACVCECVCVSVYTC